MILDSSANQFENVDINYLADKFSNNGTRVVAHYKKPLDRDVAFQIYEACIKEVIEWKKKILQGW